MLLSWGYACGPEERVCLRRTVRRNVAAILDHSPNAGVRRGYSLGMAVIDGYCDERFAKVRQVLAANLDSGADMGASVAVYLGGEPVVDIWGASSSSSPTASTAS